jgi:hypothetical protein
MMIKVEKEKFLAELAALENTYKIGKTSLEAGPPMLQAIQSIAVKEALFLLCRILLTM